MLQPLSALSPTFTMVAGTIFSGILVKLLVACAIYIHLQEQWLEHLQLGVGKVPQGSRRLESSRTCLIGTKLVELVRMIFISDECLSYLQLLLLRRDHRYIRRLVNRDAQ